MAAHQQNLLHRYLAELLIREGEYGLGHVRRPRALTHSTEGQMSRESPALSLGKANFGHAPIEYFSCGGQDIYIAGGA